MAAGLVAALVILFAWPAVILRVCRHHPLPEGPLRIRLERAVADHQIGVAQIRVWDTRGRAANAAIVGIVPGRRVLLISDAMLAAFSTDELLAVVRHEAGHVRLQHGPIRMAMVLVPLGDAVCRLTIGMGCSSWAGKLVDRTWILVVDFGRSVQHPVPHLPGLYLSHGFPAYGIRRGCLGC